MEILGFEAYICLLNDLKLLIICKYQGLLPYILYKVLRYTNACVRYAVLYFPLHSVLFLPKCYTSVFNPIDVTKIHKDLDSLSPKLLQNCFQILGHPSQHISWDSCRSAKNSFSL